MRGAARRLPPGLCALLFLAASAALGAESQAPASAARIGATQIAIPAPAGFAEPSATVPQLRSLGETMTPPTNRLLAMFVSDADLGRGRTGVAPELRRYFFVQTFRQTESRTLASADFATVKETLRTQSQQLMTRVTPTVQGYLASAARSIGEQSGNAGLSVQIGEVKVQDIIDGGDNAISVVAITKYAVQNAGKTEELPVAMAMTTMLVRGKLVYFYAFSRLTSAADIDWVRSQTQQWLPRMKLENR